MLDVHNKCEISSYQNYPCISPLVPRSSVWEVCSGVPEKFEVTKVAAVDMGNVEENEISMNSDFLQNKVTSGGGRAELMRHACTVVRTTISFLMSP